MKSNAADEILREQSRNGLNPMVFDKYKEDFARINEELERALTSRVSFINDIGEHTLLGKGKRLRPLLFLLSCRLCGYAGDDVYRLSTIFEYIHAASLLHDDVMDNATVRRERPSANHVWGNHSAVLEGDFLYSKSLSIAVDANNLPFLERLTETTLRMTEGQVLELLHTADLETSKEEYMEVITGKTAELISAACACAAIISGMKGWAVEALRKFGLNLGIAFQLTDDLLDYVSSQEMMGKPVGKDLGEGKITLPLIYTLPRLEGRELRRAVSLFRGSRRTQRDLDWLISLVKEKGSIKEIRDEARVYAESAEQCLSPFPNRASKDGLLELNRYLVDRQY